MFNTGTFMSAQRQVQYTTQQALQSFVSACFGKVGLPEEDARIIGGIMAEAELQGSDGHGVIRVPRYVRRLQAGGINKHPNIRIVQESASTAVVDGDNGMGHLVMSRAAKIAIEKARATGIGWVGSRLSNHAGPASLYARMPMAEDMIGLYFAVGNANHMAPWGGLDMLLSTNPIAAAFPGGTEPPIILDMASTVASYGKVKVKAKLGESMPEGWMMDKQGQPLLDPKRAEEGLLLPISGHKGYGLSLIIGLIAGTLNGAAMGKEVIDFNADDTSTSNTGQAIIAVNLEAFGGAERFKAAADTVARDIRNSKKMPGTDRIWLPGEQSYVKRQRHEREGIPITTAVIDELQALADALGVEMFERRA